MTRKAVVEYFESCGCGILNRSDFLVAVNGTVEFKIPDIPESFERKPFKLAMKMAGDATLRGHLFFDKEFTYSGDPDYKIEAMIVFLKMYWKIVLYF